MEEQYIQILEKTNQQLSLWTNPYGLMIGVLAVLFTMLTIIAAIIVYRQSKEYKEKLQADREEYNKKFDEFLASQKAIIEQREKQALQVEDDINKLLKEYEKKLKAGSENQKAEIEKAIEKLEEKKSSLGSTIGPLTVSPNSFSISTNVLGNKLHRCSKCNYGFIVDTNSRLSTSFGIPQTITCPKCGNTDSIFGIY